MKGLEFLFANTRQDIAVICAWPTLVQARILGSVRQGSLSATAPFVEIVDPAYIVEGEEGSLQLMPIPHLDGPLLYHSEQLAAVGHASAPVRAMYLQWVQARALAAEQAVAEKKRARVAEMLLSRLDSDPDLKKCMERLEQEERHRLEREAAAAHYERAERRRLESKGQRHSPPTVPPEKP